MAGLIWTIGVLGGLAVLLTGRDAIRLAFRGRTLGFLSSNFWLALIVVGAALAALGNVNFNVARDREKRELASAKAIGMLSAEIDRNISRIANLRRNIAAGQVSSTSLETTAWGVVSTGGLLVQVDQETLAKLTDAYHLTMQAESYRSEIIQRSTGIVQALSGAGTTTQQYVQYLLNTLNELEPKLQALKKSQSTS